VKTHRNRKRSLRTRIIGACLVALLALPAAAVAMPQRDPSIALRQENGFPLASVQKQAPVQDSAPVVRTIKVGGSDTTLATVLAAAALGIAFAGAGYVTLRLRPHPRSS